VNNQSQKFDLAKSYLGRPFAEGERFAVFHGDCVTELRRIPDGLIDLTVTSPPYNIGKEYEEISPLDEYISWSTEWLREIFRVTTRTGALALNVGYVSVPGKGKAVPLPYLLWNKTQFFLNQEIVWNYGAGVAARRSLSPRNEKVLWYVKNPEDYIFNLDSIRDPDVKYPNQKKNGKLRCNTIGKNPSDVWQIAKVTSGSGRSSVERAPHPAQFPRDLIDRIVSAFSNENHLVLDPFLGSGTSAESAIALDRFCIGFEKNLEYCSVAAERLSAFEAKEASRLFREGKPSSPQQTPDVQELFF